MKWTEQVLQSYLQRLEGMPFVPYSEENASFFRKGSLHELQDWRISD